jgi:hypothetical protein
VFAFVAAILFGLALILDLASGPSLGPVINAGTLSTAGLLCIALHFMGLGTGWDWRKQWRR